MKRKQPQASDPIDVAARALRHRDRSRRQIDERLAQAGVEEGRRADALDELERIGYVDDNRYAERRAASLSERGYGDEAIRSLLAADGVGPEAVEDAVSALEPERSRAEALVARLGASPRTAGMLARKGFGEESVEVAAGGFAAEEPEA